MEVVNSAPIRMSTYVAWMTTSDDVAPDVNIVVVDSSAMQQTTDVLQYLLPLLFITCMIVSFRACHNCYATQAPVIVEAQPLKVVDTA